MVSKVVDHLFKTLKPGDVQGKVYRLLSREPVPLYDSPIPGACITRRLQPGSLVVGFSDPGEMQQINTADQTFGYLKRPITLVPIEGLTPDGLYDPQRCAAFESALTSLEELGANYAMQQRRMQSRQRFFMVVLVLLLGMAAVLIHQVAAWTK